MDGSEPTLPATEVPSDGRPDVPGYTVGERLGAGGFGEVFAAVHAVIGREVAIKVLHHKYTTDRDAVARFVAEARAVNKVSHPGIVEIFDFGVLADGRHYCVMERLRGETLRAHLEAHPRLSIEKALPILRAVASAIDAAHAEGIAHRDVKPENVFLLPQGRVVLIDFGLAKLTREEVSITESGSVFGTPLYMSPEQCRGRAIDERTDAYSFGVMAYQVLAGTPPFAGSALELALHHLNDKPPPVDDLPKRINDALLALLAKEPVERPLPLVRVVDAMDGGARVAPKRRWWWVALPILAAAAIAFVLLRHGRGGWTVRELPLRFDGAAESMLVSPGGEDLYFEDYARQHHRVSLTTGEMQPAPPDLVGILDDMRPVSSRLNGVAIDNGPTITAAKHAVASPDGASVASWVTDRISVRDAATNTEHVVAETGSNVSDLRWSRDGRSLFWEGIRDDGKFWVHVTDVSAGTTTVLNWPFPRHGTLMLATAELPDGRLMYCAEDASGITLRVRARGDASGADEEVIAPIDRLASGCQFRRTRGGRIAIVVPIGRTRAAMIDTSSTRPELALVDSSDAERRAFGSSLDDHTIFTRARSRDRMDIQAVQLTTHHATSVPLCGGEIDVTVRHGELVRLVRTATALTLEDASCATLAEWKIDPAGEWTGLRCNETRCAVARRIGADLQIAVLSIIERSVAIIPVPSDRFHQDASLAFSRDGRTIIGCDGWSSTFIVDLATSAVQVVPVAVDENRGIQAVLTGGDRARFVVSGMSLDALYALARMDARGNFQLIWGSRFDWFSAGGENESGTIAYGAAIQYRSYILVVDPP